MANSPTSSALDTEGWGTRGPGSCEPLSPHCHSRPTTASCDVRFCLKTPCLLWAVDSLTLGSWLVGLQLLPEPSSSDTCIFSERMAPPARTGDPGQCTGCFLDTESPTRTQICRKRGTQETTKRTPVGGPRAEGGRPAAAGQPRWARAGEDTPLPDVGLGCPGHPHACWLQVISPVSRFADVESVHPLNRDAA